MDLASAGALRLVACPLLLDELDRVLARERFLRWRSRDQLDRFVADLRALADIVDDPTDVPSVTRDPDDDYLVALAESFGPPPSVPATTTSPPSMRSSSSAQLSLYAASSSTIDAMSEPKVVVTLPADQQ